MTKHDTDKLNPLYESALFVYLTLYQLQRDTKHTMHIRNRALFAT